jgi:RNA polymerase sigma factor (sigma-70 family)
MTVDGALTREHLEQTLLAQRPAIVRLCARLTGRADTAEDLAHETLLLAWRKLGTLHDPQALPAWIATIARNVCSTWLRQRRHEQRTVSLEREDEDSREPADTHALAGDPLLEALERHELVGLVREALSLLPAATRTLLLAKYGAGIPAATLAAQLQLSENAVNVRLHRGRAAIQRVFSTTLRAAANDAGLPLDEILPWQSTDLWCPHCGRQRLRLRFAAGSDRLWIECPACLDTPGRYVINLTDPVLGTVRSFTDAMRALMDNIYTFYQQRLPEVRSACPRCGGTLIVRQSAAGSPGAPLPTPTAKPAAGAAVVHSYCLECGDICWAYHSEFALYHPAGQRFWQRYGRIELTADRVIDHGGRPTLHTSYRAIDSAAEFTILRDLESYEVIHVAEPLG